MGDEIGTQALEFLLDTIYRINSTKDLPSFEREASFRLYALIPCVQVMFFPLSENSEGGSFCSQKPFVWGEKALYLDKFLSGGYEQDRFFLLMAMKSRPHAFRDTDLIPEEERTRSRVFKEIYEPQGVYYVLRIELISREKPVGQFSLFRKKEQGDFDERSLRIANLFAQHLTLKFCDLRDREVLTGHSKKQHFVGQYGLTEREFEVADLAARGLSDDEIAERLFISASTVKKHMYNAFPKLNIINRIQLARKMTEEE